MELSSKLIDWVASNLGLTLTIVISIAILVVGFVLLIKGADFFVDGASKIAEKLKVPLIVIGLTIVAFGTSAPEAAISITSSTQGNAGIAIGNIIGSNILNILIILGISALFCTIPVNKTSFRIEIPFTIFVTVVLLLLGLDGLSLLDGIILLVLFVLFFVYLIFLAKKKPEETEEQQSSLSPKDTVLKMILLVVFGLVMIVLGSDFIVSGASEVASIVGVDDRIIGLTIVALGTSLPELVTCVAAAKKGKADLAIGNIVGSNIFNILFVGGIALVCSSVQPIDFSKFVIDTCVAIFACVLLWVCLLKNRKLGKLAGLLMLGSYAIYLTYLIIML